MKWNILAKSNVQSKKLKIVDSLLENRGISSKKDREEFLNPPFPDFKLDSRKAVTRIRRAVKKKEPIVVYGDYDADGICATAIMWEALNKLGAKVLPFIPSREKEGYGLSVDGIDTILADKKHAGTKLIIAVDSGIVAHKAVDYAAKKKIDVIILDHHEKPKKLPKAYAIIHTPKLCAAGVAYFMARAMGLEDNLLELAAIATITDLLPLVGINRSIVKFGLEALQRTPRVGLRALFDVAGINSIGTYEIGYIVGPRLNASGRIESALTALRLLCTNDSSKARELAKILNDTNKDRQTMTADMSDHAKLKALSVKRDEDRILVIDHESYHQGVIGLVAGKLVEEYYLPAIVIAKADGVSKASARSIAGFNIIEAIRACDKLLINAGGHPMAAGFSIETARIEEFKIAISEYARKQITDDLLERNLRVDMELPLDQVTMELYQEITKMAPFGLGNPEPVFASTVAVENIRTVGQDGKHLKLVVSGLDAIAFNMGGWLPKLKVGDSIRIAYSISLDTFNFNHKLQLKVKDLRVSPFS